jgi:hypothetical protein
VRVDPLAATFGGNGSQRLLDFPWIRFPEPDGSGPRMSGWQNLPFLPGRLLYAAPNLTETSFDTPGSCIVTP